MNCNKCGLVCIKKGFQKNGIQKYLCKTCNLYQQENYKYLACKPFLKEQIIKCVKRSCGIRDISYITGISSTSAMRKIRIISKEIQPPDSFPFYGNYEMDEMHTKVWEGNRKTDGSRIRLSPEDVSEIKSLKISDFFIFVNVSKENKIYS